jgi:arsenate reductase
MAEGWARALHGDRLEPHSAGVAPQALDPRAIRVMAEAGVDISGQRAKHVDELAELNFALGISVCDHARQSCPRVSNAARWVHAGFADPPALARSASSEDEALAHYRRVRDEIRAFIEQLPKLLEE